MAGTVSEEVNLFNLYLDQYVNNTESPTIYHRWCLLAAISAMLGRNFYFPLGHFTIYPNQFAMLIGEPAARKSGAIKIAKALVLATGFDRIAEGRTTKEKFLLDLFGEIEAEGTGLDALLEADNDCPHELLVAADEFNNFCGAGNLEFYSLLGELWDCPKSHPVRLKNSKSFLIKQPVVNLIAANTHAGFAAAFPPEILDQGFLSRLLLIFASPTGVKLTIPPPPPEEVTALLVAKLQAIKLYVHGAATVTPEASEALDWIYKKTPVLEDARFKHYSSRRFDHLVKLTLIHAAARLSTNITVADVIMANTVLTWAEADMPKALGEFGRSKHNSVSSRIIAVLSAANKPVTITELWKQTSMDLEKYNQLADIVSGLLQADKIQRAGDGFLAKLSIRVDTGKYLDFSLLQESRDRL